MQEKNKDIAYESEKIDDKGLRASQRAILKLAESSVEKGEYDTGVDLYSKLLANEKIPRTTKIKLEKNIKTIMTRIQKTVKIAEDMLPDNIDPNKIRMAEPSSGGTGSGTGTGGAGMTGEGTGVEGSGQEVIQEMPEEVEEIISEDGDVVHQVEEEIIYEVEPKSQINSEDSGRMFPDVNLKDVDMEGVHLRDIDMANLQQGEGENKPQEKVVGEDLFSDAIDYTIDKISENVGKLIDEKIASKFPDIEEKSLREKIDEHKEEKLKKQIDETQKIEEESKEDVANVQGDVDISIAEGTNIDAQGTHISKGDGEYPITGPVPDRYTAEKILSGEDSKDFESHIDELPTLNDQFFDKMENLTHEMSDLNHNIEDIKPVFIQNISDGHFPAPSSKAQSEGKAQVEEKELNEIQKTIQDHAVESENFHETVGNLAKEPSQEIPFDNLSDVLLKQSESLNDIVESVKDTQETSKETLETIRDALFQQVETQKDLTKALEGTYSEPVSQEEIKKAEEALFSPASESSIEGDVDTGQASDFTPQVDDNEINLSDDFFNAVNSLQSDMDHVKTDIDTLKHASIEEISDSIFEGESKKGEESSSADKGITGLFENMPDLNQLQDVLSKAVEMTKAPVNDLHLQGVDTELASEGIDLTEIHDQIDHIAPDSLDLGDEIDTESSELLQSVDSANLLDIQDKVNQMMPENLSSNVDEGEEGEEPIDISKIQDKIDFITSTSSNEDESKDNLQKNIELAGSFFDKVNEFADRLSHGGMEHNVDQALAYLDQDDSWKEQAPAEQRIDESMKETLSNVSEHVDAAVMDHEMSQLVDQELEGGIDAESLMSFASGIKDATEGLNEAAQGIKDAAEDIRDSNVITEEQKLEDLTRRSDALEKEVDTFKSLVEMLEKEQAKREESENTLKDFESILDELKGELDKKKDGEKQGNVLGTDTDAGYEEDDELDVFRANEELLETSPQYDYNDEEYNKVQFYPDIESVEEDYDDYDEGFKTLDEVMNEDLSHAREYTKDDANRDEAIEQFHQDIDPAFIPTPYSTDYDYKNEDGFFQDVTGAPVVISQPVIVSDEAMKKANDAQAIGPNAPEQSPQTQPQIVAPSMVMPQQMMQQSYEKPKKPKRSLKEPIRLTYDFTNLFQNRYYRKYRDMLNEAATLVAEKKLDEALEYYYVIQDQNIPHSFKIMIQQNIRDIEETIADTFRFSDTIVKVGEAGDVSRVKVAESSDTIDSDMRVVSNEISFNDS